MSAIQTNDAVWDKTEYTDFEFVFKLVRPCQVLKIYIPHIHVQGKNSSIYGNCILVYSTFYHAMIGNRYNTNIKYFLSDISRNILNTS